MSQRNVDIVGQTYEHMNRRDWAAVLAAMDEDIVLVVHESVSPDTGIFRGREAASRWFGDWFLAFGKDYRFELEENRSIGDRVFAVARHHGYGRSSGAEVELTNVAVVSLRAGKVVQVELYGSRTEALKAEGLRD